VGDLGGGSLELVALDAGHVKEAITLPLGALHLMDRADGDIAVARRLVDGALSKVTWLDQFRGQNLFVVGGAWRSLAKIHMARTDYAFKVLQHYEMSRGQAWEISGLIGSLGERSLESISEVSRRRVETLPYGALVLERLLAAVKVKRVVVSAYGLREGILFSALPRSLQSQDPLIESCHEMAGRLSRNPLEGKEFVHWTRHLFSRSGNGETDNEARLRQAICLLSGIGWRSHPDHRGFIAFREVMYGSFGGVTHDERLFIGSGTCYRYKAGPKPGLPGSSIQLDEGELRRASIIGAALRLGTKLSGGAVDIIPKCTLRPEGGDLVLSLPNGLSKLDGESIQKRLSLLAKLMELSPKVEVAD
jgi:exopolyphosphatase/guanosine-5'-triphosphate,3'-diphosphate pyrophosphatase